MAEMRMDAYYFGFEPTGIEAIDKILAAVACAGKSYHHTESWHDITDAPDYLRGDSPAAWIQNAAIDAATHLKEQETVTVGMVTAALAAVGERDVSLASNRRVEVTKMIQAAVDWKANRDAHGVEM